MFNKGVVFEALKLSEYPRFQKSLKRSPVGQDILVSMLIHDVFGGEILKTHEDKKSWHFYNRVDGERVDFTSDTYEFEDIPSNTEDIYSNYFDQADYSTLLTKFIRAFEESLGLDNHRSGLTA